VTPEIHSFPSRYENFNKLLGREVHLLVSFSYSLVDKYGDKH